MSKELEKDFSFFEKDSVFFESSKTSAPPNRLNNRGYFLIHKNKHLFENKKILDLASHDGRFSYQCIKANCRFVLGIEFKKHLIENAKKNFSKLKIPKSKFKFVQGDALEQISKLPDKSFDVVLCLGFFYHCIYHLPLLKEMKRVARDCLILDTNIVLVPTRLDKFFWLFGKLCPRAIRILRTNGVMAVMFDGGKEGSAANSVFNGLVGVPNKEALEMMLRAAGFSFEYLDTKPFNNNWQDLRGYKNGSRVSLICRP